jgi:uncharacterized protein YbaR (Trm112 family)
MPDAPTEGFPEKLFCPQCKRHYNVAGCRSSCNTLLTEVKISCPRCRRRLRRMRLKDWYDHYVQGQSQETQRV